MSKIFNRFLAEKQTALMKSQTVPGFGASEALLRQHLPEPVKRYLKKCGFDQRMLPRQAEVIWKDSAIRLAPDKPWMPLKTIQFNSTPFPCRIVYMKAMMMGIIPFEGRDIFNAGSGHMLGKIVGMIPVFDAQDKEIAFSGLVTVLAEAFMVPGYMIESYTSWQEIDDHSAKAVMVWQDLKVEGIFHFDDAGDMVRFDTDERYYANPKGFNELQKWSVFCDAYTEKNGIRFPERVRAVWFLPEGEYEYWRGTLDHIKFD